MENKGKRMLLRTLKFAKLSRDEECKIVYRKPKSRSVLRGSSVTIASRNGVVVTKE
jgi:hypothetical protein